MKIKDYKYEIDFDEIQEVLDEELREVFSSLDIHNMSSIYNYYHIELESNEEITIEKVVEDYLDKNFSLLSIIYLEAINLQKNDALFEVHSDIVILADFLNAANLEMFVEYDLKENKLKEVRLSTNVPIEKDTNSLIHLKELGFDVSIYELQMIFGEVDFRDKEFVTKIHQWVSTNLKINEENLKKTCQRAKEKCSRDISKKDIFFRKEDEKD